jgi:hypothetical protein
MASSPSPAATPIATAGQHECFICLFNDAETPGRAWVNPCPCTLEAHEDCMLRWVAETEQSRRTSKNVLRCPACNARIGVDEPYDVVVHLRDRLHRTYSRATPAILAFMLMSGAGAASSYYGVIAARMFAGPGVMQWLGLPQLMHANPQVPWWRWRAAWMFSFKFWTLSLIAPALAIQRALPSLGSLFLIPSSLAVGLIPALLHTGMGYRGMLR